jgi:hypothetical protein
MDKHTSQTLKTKKETTQTIIEYALKERVIPTPLVVPFVLPIFKIE